jgi:anti-sigma factor RsiW
MSTSAIDVTEDELHAFVDGQLDAAHAPAVLDWMQHHPDDAQRVAQWQVQRLQMRKAAREIEVGETPAALSGVVLRAAGRARRHAAWQQAAAAVVLLALGATGGAWWGRLDVPLRGLAGESTMAGSPTFVRDALAAYAVFTPEKRHPVEVAASDEAHLVQWLSRRLGAPLKAPSLVGHGWQLLGGRLLPGEQSPRAQFMYENGQGRRMTLYVASFGPGQSPAQASFRSLREGARESFYWVEGSFGYALSAELPPEQVQALAREVYAQLTR